MVQLKGEGGLAKNFHEHWQDMKENAEVVKTTVTAYKKVLSEMLAANVYEINSVLFLPYRKERTIPLKGEMQVELISL